MVMIWKLFYPSMFTFIYQILHFNSNYTRIFETFKSIRHFIGYTICLCCLWHLTHRNHVPLFHEPSFRVAVYCSILDDLFPRVRPVAEESCLLATFYNYIKGFKMIKLLSRLQSLRLTRWCQSVFESFASCDALVLSTLPLSSSYPMEVLRGIPKNGTKMLELKLMPWFD